MERTWFVQLDPLLVFRRVGKSCRAGSHYGLVILDREVQLWDAVRPSVEMSDMLILRIRQEALATNTLLPAFNHRDMEPCTESSNSGWLA